MRHCKILNFLFEAIPFRPWQDLILRRHMERCPDCRARLAGREEARRVLSHEDEFRGRVNFWPGIKVKLAEAVPTRPRVGWPRTGLARTAAAAGLLILAAGLSVVFFRGFRLEQPAPASPPAKDQFEMNYIRIGGQPADSYIFQSRDSRTTLVWAAKKAKGGLS